MRSREICMLRPFGNDLELKHLIRDRKSSCLHHRFHLVMNVVHHRGKLNQLDDGITPWHVRVFSGSCTHGDNVNSVLERYNQGIHSTWNKDSWRSQPSTYCLVSVIIKVLKMIWLVACCQAQRLQ